MSGNLPIPVDGLPKSLVDVAESLGVRVALKLIAEFGGLEMKFPKKPSADHPIILALGESDGYALCEFMSGCATYVPHARSGTKARDVRRLVQQGMDRNKVAQELKISVRHVRRIVNKADFVDFNQLELFDE